jgi:septum formation protein
MRHFSDEFLEDYLAREGEGMLSTVGCYRLEDIGVQLFSRIEGDYFTILGLPMLGLLDLLRRHGALAE